MYSGLFNETYMNQYLKYWNIINRAMLIKSFFYSFISYKIPYHLTSIHLLCESVIFFTTYCFPTLFHNVLFPNLDNKIQQSQRKCGIQEVIVLSKIWTNIKFPDRFSIALQITLYQEKKFYFFFSRPTLVIFLGPWFILGVYFIYYEWL